MKTDINRRLRTFTRFEREAEVNSKMAYSHVSNTLHFCPLNSKPKMHSFNVWVWVWVRVGINVIS